MRVSPFISLLTRVGIRFGKSLVHWKHIEHFDETWKLRIQKMSKYIHSGESVIDLGCGLMWLKEYLPRNCTYTGVDYTKRNPETVLCDFNKKNFPKQQADVAFVSGCLEYIDDPAWFAKQIASSANKCVVSYCTMEAIPSMKSRIQLCWKNHMTKNQLIQLFENQNFKLTNSEDGENSIFIFEK